MLHLLWTLLNTAVFVVFLITCFRATKLLRQELGLSTTLFLVFGILSFVSRSTDSPTAGRGAPNTNAQTWTLNPVDSLQQGTMQMVNVELEKTLLSTYGLTIRYQQGPQTNHPIDAYSVLTGLVGGIKWKPSDVSVVETRKGQFRYTVMGTVEWQLLGTTLYTEPKQYQGTVSVP
ncbi:hypothetical protein F5984_02490 [Rudanella paleaurantiibacter]|uniref:Uncharacterized protein n=1 Tax=Rudanella paleaurantiibacter TaxID=2614655 RepID=A0A7J5U5H4_9BACT|nr:hypothetical protein [Rudanella paleaurantiibacter]KAB7732837.1 hypothetical protein F5984_02490 [Rudanella paleaurantiibacter]